MDLSLLKESARQAKALFFDIFYPRYCLGCGRPDIWFCEGCWRSLARTKIETYFFAATDDAGSNLGLKNSSLDCLFSVVSYTNKLALKSIKAFKYSFVREIGFDLGLLLAWQFCQAVALGQFAPADSLKRFIQQDTFDWPSYIAGYFSQPPAERYSAGNFFPPAKKPQPPANILLLPVPLHKRRQRWRGFNQAEIIARPLAEYFGLDLSLELLVRRRYTRPQAKLEPAQRRQSIKNSFVCRRQNLAGKVILLIDDVATTGATLAECARILKSAGAKKVCGLVVARG